LTSPLFRNIPVKDPSNEFKYDYPINFCYGRTCENAEEGGQKAIVSDSETSIAMAQVFFNSFIYRKLARSFQI